MLLPSFFSTPTLHQKTKKNKTVWLIRLPLLTLAFYTTRHCMCVCQCEESASERCAVHTNVCTPHESVLLWVWGLLRLVKLLPRLKISRPQCVCVCVRTCVCCSSTTDCRMKEHLVRTDSVQSGLCEVSNRGQALSSAEQSSERWREETSLFVPSKKLKKGTERAHFRPQQIDQTWQMHPNNNQAPHPHPPDNLSVQHFTKPSLPPAERLIGRMCESPPPLHGLNSWLKRFITIIKYEGGDYFYMTV